MNKNQKLLPLKGFYYSFLAFVLLLSSCEMDWKEIGNSKIPEFAGTWVSESDQNKKIYIKMVHDKLYQVKGDGNIVSGSYSLSSDFTHLSFETEISRNFGRDRKKVIYEIHYSKDGRLFSPNNNVFFNRAK